jgi:hypothetical protein
MTAEEAVADIRDGKFLPAALACPGLKPALASALDGILASDVDRASAPRPGLAELAAALGEPGSGGPASFILSLEDDERRRLEQERERRETRTAKTVAKRRFWRRHGKLVLGIAAAAVAVGLGAWNVIDARADRFTTAGLSAREVAETYYGAFDALDPDRLEACLAKGAPKTDVEAVTNLFVIFRVRQAYESQAPYLKAEEWLKAGSPATEKTVFGIADLRIERLETIGSWPPTGSSPRSGRGTPGGPVDPDAGRRALEDRRHRTQDPVRLRISAGRTRSSCSGASFG